MNREALSCRFIIFDSKETYRLKRLLIYIILLFAFAAAAAQSPKYLFQRLGVKDGLFEPVVHQIQQDAKGFLWLNFRTLVQRYDGHRFVNFIAGVHLPEGNVRSMIMDKENRLWLLSGNATLGYLNPDNFKYHPVKVNIPKGFSTLASNLLINKQNQVLLLWKNEGFITADVKADAADEKYNPFTLPGQWKPNHILQDDENNYWIAGSPGLMKYNPAKKMFSYRGHNAGNDPAVKAFEQLQAISGVFTDKAGNLWAVLLQNGKIRITSFNLKSGNLVQWEDKVNTALDNKVYDPFEFTETAGGALWLTGNNVFCKINTETKTVQSIPNISQEEYSIRYDVIFDAFEDSENNIWLGTNKGLFRFNPQAQLFTIIEHKAGGGSELIKSPVTDFLETADGHLLASSIGGGIFGADKNYTASSSINLLANAANKGTMAWSMIQRANGDIWCGMQGGSILVYEAATKKIFYERPLAAGGSNIRQLTQDRQGNIWIGTQNGAIIKWDAVKKDFQLHHQFNAVITRIYFDSQTKMWAGTDKDGLYNIDTNTGAILQHYTSAGAEGKKLRNAGVSDILQYDDSIYYIAGNGISILNKNTGTFKYFTITNGLPSANITNLLKDKSGNIWMTTGAGIVSYHPVLKRLSHYNASDGLPDCFYSSGAATQLKNGHIVFGTNEGIVLFDAADLARKKYLPPKVHISAVEIMSKSVNVDSLLNLDVIKLSHSQNGFTFMFSTLKYKDAYLVYYMLEGIDKSWKQTGRMSVVSYNFLPPGNYVLKAACLNEDGSIGEITSVKIHIAAPFYKQWWFYSAIALMLVGLLLWGNKERMKRKEAVENMRSNIAGQLHKEINIALNNINVLSEMAKLKAGTEPQKSKEFIEQINTKSQGMIDAMDDMLWSIDPGNDSMQKAIERIKEFIDTQMNRYAVKINLTVDDRIHKLNLPMQLRHETFILFKSSLAGLLQAGAENISIKLAKDKKNLLYQMKCDTSGADTEKMNHYLRNRPVMEKMELLGAAWDVQVYKSHAVVECRIPLGNA